MIITLDGQRLDEALTPDATLQALIDQVRTAHTGDRLIISVAVDGQRLDDNDLSAQLGQSVAGHNQIDLESGDRHQLVHDALCGLAQEFEQAAAQLPNIADRLSTPDVAVAIRDIGAFVGLWQTCHRIIAQCSGLLGEDLTTCAHEARPVRQWLDDLVDKLTELRSALESHDTVLLADLVRYEFPALGATWQNLLASLAAHASAQPTPA
jgi:hypothetical protein